MTEKNKTKANNGNIIGDIIIKLLKLYNKWMENIGTNEAILAVVQTTMRMVNAN